MEEMCFALCERIFETCKKGYEIFYEDELTEVLPEGVKNRETLEAVLKKLVADGCIDVKYARGNAFCIAALKRYEREIKTEDTAAVGIPADVQQSAPAAVFPVTVYIAVAASAFFGSIIPTVVAFILGALT